MSAKIYIQNQIVSSSVSLPYGLYRAGVADIKTVAEQIEQFALKHHVMV